VNLDQGDRDRDGIGDVCDPNPAVRGAGFPCGCGDPTGLPGQGTVALLLVGLTGWGVRRRKQ